MGVHSRWQPRHPAGTLRAERAERASTARKVGAAPLPPPLAERFGQTRLERIHLLIAVFGERPAGGGDRHLDDPTVGRVRRARDQPGALEARQDPGDPLLGDEAAPGEIGRREARFAQEEREDGPLGQGHTEIAQGVVEDDAQLMLGPHDPVDQSPLYPPLHDSPRLLCRPNGDTTASASCLCHQPDSSTERPPRR